MQHGSSYSVPDTESDGRCHAGWHETGVGMTGVLSSRVR